MLTPRCCNTAHAHRTVSPWAHALQNLALILLSILLLPLSGLIIAAACLLGTPYRWAVARHRHALRHAPGLQKPEAAQGSAPLLDSLLEIILKEKVDLWVSCSGVASAVEDGEAKEVVEHRTSCKAVQFDVQTTQMLHEKDSFVAHARQLGLAVPETHNVTSPDQVEDALDDAPEGAKFILKPIGMDDAARADLTLLPKSTRPETRRHLDGLGISPEAPFILQRFIDGREFCTHALVVRGEVRAFVACPSAELLMHYEALPPSSPLSQAMLRFTQRFAAAGGDDFSGHLSFDFLVENPTPAEIELFPIECNPRAHTAVVLFSDTPAMLDAYLSLLSPPRRRQSHPVIAPHRPGKYYLVGHDLATRLLLPICVAPLPVLVERLGQFFTHVFTWRDGTLALWDPLPWLWLYHVYWPLQFWWSLRDGGRWSRVNVSTTKMFHC